MSQHRDWIPMAEAARVLEVSGTVIRRLVDRQQLSIRALPGCHPRVSAPELARLVDEHTHRRAAS